MESQNSLSCPFVYIPVLADWGERLRSEGRNVFRGEYCRSVSVSDISCQGVP